MQLTLRRAEALALDRTTVAALLEDLSTIDARIRQLTIEKKLCAKAFGLAKKTHVDLAVLKSRMQSISTELSTTNSTRRITLDLLNQLFAVEQVAPLATACVRPVKFVAHEQTALGVRVLELIDVDKQEWSDYVQQHSGATLYHDIRWRTVISNAFGHDTHYLCARDENGRVCGVLPLVRQHSLVFGDFLTSIPFLNYGGALADSRAIELQLMHAATRLAEQHRVSHIEFRDTVPRDEWPCRDDKVSMQLALPSEAPALFAEFGSKLRAQIRRPERDGGTVAFGGIELLDEFYTVFAHNMRDLGTPVYAKHWFATICRNFADQTTIAIARIDGRTVGTAFLMRHRDTMEVPWASTLRSVNSSGINMLLYWRCLEYAIGVGCRVFDFGRSSHGNGTYRFKAQWGAQAVPLYWHYWLREGGALPKLNPDNPRFRFAIAAWQRLPVWVTKIIGPSIVRSIP